jgi:hypothetical protein
MRYKEAEIQGLDRLVVLIWKPLSELKTQILTEYYFHLRWLWRIQNKSYFTQRYSPYGKIIRDYRPSPQ